MMGLLWTGPGENRAREISIHGSSRTTKFFTELCSISGPYFHILNKTTGECRLAPSRYPHPSDLAPGETEEARKERSANNNIKRRTKNVRGDAKKVEDEKRPPWVEISNCLCGTSS
jgi:hypothetical protein